MQEIKIHDIESIIQRMNDELKPMRSYKEMKIQKIYDIFHLNRDKLKTITHVTCSETLYPVFIHYFADVIDVRYYSLLDSYEFIFTNESEFYPTINPEISKAWQKAHDIIEKSFTLDFIKPFDFTIQR